MKKEVIHNDVCEKRSDRAITQSSLAQAVGVSRQTIAAIERGNYTPSVLLALKIARFFRVSVEDVFTIVYEK